MRFLLAAALLGFFMLTSASGVLVGAVFEGNDKPNATVAPFPRQTSHVPLPARLVYQQTGPTWFEDIAVRRDGSLLVTETVTGAKVRIIARPWAESPVAADLFDFSPWVTGVLGIAETAPDRFVVVGANFTARGVPVPATARVFSVDFSPCPDGAPCSRVQSGILASPLNITFPNGVASLPWDNNTVLVADSAEGNVHAVDVRTGADTVVATLPEMAALPETAPVRVGIVGIRVRVMPNGARYLYFSNGFRGGVWRVPVDAGGRPLERSQVRQVVGGLGYTWLEHFAFSADGTVWSATMPNNTIYATKQGQPSRAVLGSNGTLVAAGLTALALGRTEEDRGILYACTNGGMLAPVNGTLVEPGKVLAINITGF